MFKLEYNITILWVYYIWSPRPFSNDREITAENSPDLIAPLGMKRELLNTVASQVLARQV